MKIKPMLLVAFLSIGVLPLSSFKISEKSPSHLMHRKQDVSLLGSATAPDGSVYDIYGYPNSAGPGGSEDEVTGAVQQSTGISYTAVGHSYGTNNDEVTCSVYNANGSVRARINGPMVTEY